MDDKKKGKKAKATTSFVESLTTDDATDKEVRSDLVDLIKSFFRMLKTTIIHDVNNKATISIIEQCVSLLNKAIQSDGVISIQQSDQKIFINKTVLSVGLSSYMTMRNLVDLLESRKVGGVTFSGEVTTEQPKAVLQTCRGDAGISPCAAADVCHIKGRPVARHTADDCFDGV